MNVEIRGKQFSVDDQHPDFWPIIGRWEPRTFEVLDAHLTPDYTFVDLGAWIGPISMFALTLTPKVFSFEPDPVAAGFCRHNAPGATVIEQAVTDYDGMVVLSYAVLGASTTRFTSKAGAGIGVADKSFAVTCRRLQNIPKGNPLFIKMDIEGGEETLLTQFEFFEEYRPKLLVSCHPFWWRNNSTWARLDALKELYGNVVNTDHLYQPLAEIQRTEHGQDLFFS